MRKADRLSHTYLIGKTGTGKSTALETFIRQDLHAGSGLALIDPHGDLVERIAKHIPDHRKKDLIYFNVPDPAQPFGYNPLKRVEPGRRPLAASGMLEVFHKQWGERAWGARMEHILRNALLAVVGTLLIWVAAKIQVPFYPVPLTLQTFVVLTLGMAYGWRLAGATLILYLVEGAAGLPVFAGTPEKGIGLVYMMGGTGGYLVGYVLAAVVCGWLAERGWDRNVITTALAMLAANVLIYIPGLLWLGSLYGWDKPILEWGLTPFILGDLTKLALAALALPLAWKLIGRRR